MVSATAGQSVAVTFDFGNTIVILSSGSHMYLDVFHDPTNPATFRREFAPATSYTCLISSARVLSVSTSALVRIGASGSWSGIGANIDLSLGFSGGPSWRHTNLFYQNLLPASGKTMEDLESECAEWSQLILSTQAVATTVPGRPVVIMTNDDDDVSCTYQDQRSRPVKELIFTFANDDSGTVAYRTQRLGPDKTKTYVMEKGIDRYKGMILSVTDANSRVTAAAKVAFIRDVLNGPIKAASANEKAKWAIRSCN
jgi:hypothetical protein